MPSDFEYTTDGALVAEQLEAEAALRKANDALEERRLLRARGYGNYGTFIGEASPITGGQGVGVSELVGRAMGQLARSTLTTEQAHGVLRLALDAIEARDQRIDKLEAILRDMPVEPCTVPGCTGRA